MPRLTFPFSSFLTPESFDATEPTFAAELAFLRRHWRAMSVPAATPASCSGFSLAHPSRRQFLFGATVLSSGFLLPGQSVAGTLWNEIAQGVTRWKRSGDGYSLLLGEMVVFQILPGAFAGNPQLRFDQNAVGWHLELTGARFPGTKLPADFTAHCTTKAGVEWLDWTFHGLNATLRGPLKPFLSQQKPLVGKAKLSHAVLASSFTHLRWQGQTKIEFWPDWTLQLQGDELARWEWQGAGARADACALKLQPQQRTTAIALARSAGTSWPVAQWLASVPAIQADAEAFDGWNFVTSENQTPRALLESDKLLVRPLGDSAHHAPLLPLRYAHAVLSSGGASLLGTFGPSSWATKEADWHFDFVGGETPAEKAPFEIALEGQRLKHWHCEPQLQALASPLRAGDVSAEFRLQDRTRASFAPPIQLVSADAPRLAQRPILPRRIVPIDPILPRVLPTPTPAPAPVQSDGQRQPQIGGILGSVLGNVLRPKPPVVEIKPNSQVIKPVEKPPFVVIDPNRIPNLVLATEPDLVVVRPDDLLSLSFRFVNLQLSGGQLKRSGAGPAYITVEFPPQALAEQVWQDGAPVTLPAKKRASGPSRIAFQIPANISAIDFSIDALLSWSKWQMVAAPSTLHDPFAAKTETAIELPFRLVLSPEAGRWLHSNSAKKSGARTELWHTRLAANATPAPLTTLDSPALAPNRKLRAVWPKPNPISIKGSSSDFTTSIEPVDRNALVQLMTGAGTSQRWFEAENLSLSTLGGTLRGQTGGPGWAVENLPPDASLSAWRHVATLGRDHYVRIVHEGYLFPFGHRAAKITIVERTFENDNGRQVAVLRRREFVIVREVEKTYHGVGFGTQSERRMPLKSVRLHTLETPSLQPGQAVLIAVGSTGPFNFNLSGLDEAGQKVEWSMPLVWVQRGSSGPTGKFDDVSFPLAANSMGSVGALVNAWRDSKYGTVAMRGQKLAFAAPNVPGDTTFAVDSLGWAGAPRAISAPNQPNFLPVVGASNIAIPVVQHLTHDDAASTVRLSDQFVNNGFGGANAGEVLLEVVQVANLTNAFAGTPVSTLLQLGVQTAGGLVQPSFGITGLSRQLGPVGGTLTKIAAGQFDPKEYFKETLENARLLGGIRLIDLLQATGLDLSQAPKMISEVKNAAADASNAANALENAIPKEIVSSLHWETGALESIAIFEPSGATKLTLDAKATVKPSGAQMDVRGRLNDFKLNFFGFVFASFTKLEFISKNGQKPDINCDLSPDEPVSFGGPLSFIQTLADLIPADRFSDPPSLDISPTGLTAGYSFGLPDVSAGAWGFSNIKFGASLTIPFTAQPARVRFNFCERQDPLAVVVDGLTGGGFCAMSLGTDGIERFEASFEIGGSLKFNFGVAKGGVYLMVGIYFELRSEEHAIVLAGYVRAGGSLSILGLISMSIEMNMELAYDSGPNLIKGSVGVKVKIHIAFFSKSVSFTAHKEFEAPGAFKKVADAITELPHQEAFRLVALPSAQELENHHAEVANYWSQVCAAYA